MLPDIYDWMPLKIDDIEDLMGDFDRWCLCGGESIDLFLGRTTRAHGDTDIGIFRSDLHDGLMTIESDRVYLCDPPGHHRPWHEAPVPDHINDIWILSADRLHWVLQILVFSDDIDYVYYKRNKAIRWRKDNHMWQVGKFRILNPLIAFLYKSNQQTIEGKDIQDIQVLIEEWPDNLIKRGGTTPL